MKKKTLIIVLIMLICTIVGIKTYKTYMGTEVEEIKKKEKHNNYLTFYVQQDNGSYAEQSGNTFPTGTYQINTSMTKCEDQFGEKVTPSFSMNNGSVTVTSTRTVYCTLYMDKANYTATFNFASDTAPLSGTTWNASWTLPNANQYCLTQSSSLSDCNWINLPQGVNGSYSSSEKFTTTGTFTYYFYVKNSSGIMASASDTITIIETCSFAVTGDQDDLFVEMITGIGITSYGMKSYALGTPESSITKTYNSTNSMKITSTTINNIEIIGFVKNSEGIEGTCTAYVEKPNVPSGECEYKKYPDNSGGGYYCTEDHRYYTYLGYCQGSCTTISCPTGYQKPYAHNLAMCYKNGSWD